MAAPPTYRGFSCLAQACSYIVRRQPRSAARPDTAKLLVENPTLRRLRELEVLEKIAAAGHLKVVLGEKGPCRPRDQPAVTIYAPSPSNRARGNFFRLSRAIPRTFNTCHRVAPC